MKTCTKCGNPINETTNSCTVCGSTFAKKQGKIDTMLSGIKPIKKPTKPKRKFIFILLTLVGYGLNWYYIGEHEKFLKRFSSFIKGIIYTITIVLFPLGMFYMFYAFALSLYDIFTCLFVKKDAYGNNLKWF